MTRTVDFLFDYISPYAYLAATQLRALGARRGVHVEPVPVLLGALLASTGSRGPAEVPVRREYMIHDVTRLARSLGVPIAPPATHPFNPLAALRITYAAEPVRRWQLVEALFRAAWVEGRRVDDAGIVAGVASELGLDAEALTAAAATPAIKGALREATERAISKGVFGVPTMLVDGELFWGVDSLALLDRWLAGVDVPDADELVRWRRIPASASRKGLLFKDA